MDIKHFHALRPGPASKGRGDLAMVSVVDLGELQVPSGKLGACDPYVDLARPLTFSIPPGSYPARVSVADVSEEHDGSHLRMAYLSVVLSEAPSMTVGPAEADPDPSDPDAGQTGHFWAVGVDAGTVAFVDARAVSTAMPHPDEVDWHEEIFDSAEPESWYVQTDADSPYPAKAANIVMPLAQRGENVVLCESGWGDGSFPVLETRDADGNLTGIHIDLRVVGDPNDVGRLDAPADTSRELDVDGFFALKTGQAPSTDVPLANLRVLDLGQVRVPSGNLGSCDVFVQLDDPVVTPIAPGDYPVRVTMADVSAEQDGSHERQAYLSVVLSEAPYTSVEPAPIWAGFPPAGDAYGFVVDAGTAGFVDAAAVASSMPGEPTTWYDEVFENSSPDSWFEQFFNDGELPEGAANIVMPLAEHGENVVVTQSGWGDGFYPVLRTFAADGTVTGIHIDFGVVGTATDGLSVRGPGYVDPPDQSAAAPPTGEPPAPASTSELTSDELSRVNRIGRGYLLWAVVSAFGMVVVRYTPAPWWAVMPLVLIAGVALMSRLIRPLAATLTVEGGLLIFMVIWVIAFVLGSVFGSVSWGTVAWWMTLLLYFVGYFLARSPVRRDQPT